MPHRTVIRGVWKLAGVSDFLGAGSVSIDLVFKGLIKTHVPDLVEFFPHCGVGQCRFDEEQVGGILPFFERGREVLAAQAFQGFGDNATHQNGMSPGENVIAGIAVLIQLAVTIEIAQAWQ
ncbi:hypothetical protein D3C80_1552430 [compost metagenome]